MQCSHCGSHVPQGAENCPYCAAPLGAAQNVQFHPNGFSAPPQGAAPSYDYPPQGYSPQGYPPQGYAPPPGYPPQGSYPPQGYYPPGYDPYTGQIKPRTAPLVLGIVGIVFSLLYIVAFGCCIPGLVMALNDRKSGRSQSLVPMVLNIIGLSLAFLWMCLFIVV